MENADNSSGPGRQPIRYFVVGIFMGSADAVPGISGGTVALIAGIYGRLLAAINALTPRRLLELGRALLPLDGGISVGRASEIFRELDLIFVATLLTGIATAVVVVGRVVEHAAAQFPVLLFGLFFGLIGSSAAILWRELEMGTAGRWLAALTGLTFAFTLSGGVQILNGGGLGIIFLAGAIAISAMILPGISGSLLLIILGQYLSMYESLNNFLDGVFELATGGSFADVIEPGQVVFAFLLGGVIGLLTVARVLRKLLDTNRGATLAFLVALIIGALRAPITELTQNEGVKWTMSTVAEFTSVALLGAVLILALDWIALDIGFDTV